jgi:hypothetical protein
MKPDMTMAELVLYVSKLEERIEAIEKKTIKKSGIVLAGARDSYVDFIQEKKKRIGELSGNEE